MENLDSSGTNVNATPNDVAEWAQRMAERGEYKRSSVRVYKTALTQITSVLAPGEPNDPQSLLEHLPHLAQRWATKNGGKPETARTYLAKATGLLQDYLKFQEDPLGFRGRSRTTKSSPPKAKAASKMKRKPKRNVAAAPVHSLTGQVRSYPLGEGREIRFVLPEGEPLTSLEAGKFSVHLMTLAGDFSPEHAKMLLAFGDRHPAS